MEKLNIKSKETLRNVYLDPAIKQELIKLTIHDKPQTKIKNITKYKTSLHGDSF